MFRVFAYPQTPSSRRAPGPMGSTGPWCSAIISRVRPWVPAFAGMTEGDQRNRTTYTALSTTRNGTPYASVSANGPVNGVVANIARIDPAPARLLHG